MCQLTLLNLRDKTLNQVYLSTILQANSFGNSDGTGFLSVNKDGTLAVVKSKESADAIDELGLRIRDNIRSNLPILAHVRAASKGIEIKDENSHPFEGKRFILAHNGRLYPKDEVVTSTWSANDDTSLASDSLVFLHSLEERAKKHKIESFYDILKNTMEMYKGKFALLIYDKESKSFYVCRGSSAELHIQSILTCPDAGGELESIGFIVNTRKNTLSDSSDISTQIGQIATGKRLFQAKIEELDKNTLYKVEGIELTKLGEIKENPVVVQSAHQSTNINRSQNTTYGEVNLEIPIWRHASAIEQFMNENFLCIWDIDALLMLFCGVPMADIAESDLDIFVNVIMPKISASKNVKNRVKKIMGDSFLGIYPHVYAKVPGLQYPWMVSDNKGIDALCKYIKEWKKRSA